jgi:pilus assembly protein CpaB
MEWLTDLAAARSGDAEARTRLFDYLTPFVHGAALALTAHHVAASIVPRTFEELQKLLPELTDARVPAMAMTIARRLANAIPPVVELVDRSAQIHEARQLVTRLRTLPASQRERLLLRLLEGIPGPEQVQVLGLEVAATRSELESAANEASRLLGQAALHLGDGYLWALEGSPTAFVAKLETVLPVLRYEPGQTFDPQADVRNAMSVTNLEPLPEGRRETAASARPLALPPPLPFRLGDDHDDVTTNADLKDPRAQNPFERAAATIAATDLPVEAHGSVPPPEPTGARPPAATVEAPRPVPVVSDDRKGSTSGRSNSGKSNSSKSRSRPKPTPVPTAQDLPPADAVERAMTEVRLDAVGDNAAQAAKKRTSLIGGSTPFLVAAPLVLLGVAISWLGLFSTEANARRSWRLVPVVVAAEDLPEGARLTQENLAVRSVPQIDNPTTGTPNASMVPAERIADILEGRLAKPVMSGDPIFWTQLVSQLAMQHLQDKVRARARALTLTTTVNASVGASIKPGDRVDIILSLTVSKEGLAVAPMPKAQAAARDRAHDPAPKAVPRGAETTSVTVAQNLNVIAAGKVTETTAEGTLDDRLRRYSNLTVLVLPEEAERLVLAARLGRLTFTLRNPDDNAPDLVEYRYSGVETLLTGERLRQLQKQRGAVISQIRATPVGGR